VFKHEALHFLVDAVFGFDPPAEGQGHAPALNDVHEFAPVGEQVAARDLFPHGPRLHHPPVFDGAFVEDVGVAALLELVGLADEHGVERVADHDVKEVVVDFLVAALLVELLDLVEYARPLLVLVGEGQVHVQELQQRVQLALHDLLVLDVVHDLAGQHHQCNQRHHPPVDEDVAIGQHIDCNLDEAGEVLTLGGVLHLKLHK